MARILLTWEFGGGMGHLNQFPLLVDRLIARGHRLIVAVPQDTVMDQAARLFGAKRGVSIRAGHSWPPPTDPRARQAPTHSLADVLHLFGYHDPQRLGQAARIWTQIVDAEKPDLVIADFAPTLAVCGAAGRPVLALGNGYAIPPGGQMLPPIRPWQETLKAFSRANEGEILMAVNRVRWSLKLPPIDFVADLFNGADRRVFSLPALDPYAAHRAAPAMPPFSPGKIPVGLPIPERDRRILAYLPAKHPKLQALVTAMGATGARVDLVLPHPPATLQIPKTVHLHQSPLDLAEVLPAVRLLVYHGGLITAHAAIMAGTPQAVFPVNLEHLITGTSLEALGVARPLPEKTVERSYKDYISGLLEDAPLAQMALESAALMRPELIEAILESTVQACENLL